MRQVNVTELRSHLPKYLSSVQKGSEIWITLHGQVIARLLPPPDTKKEAQEKLKALRIKKINYKYKNNQLYLFKINS